MKFIGHVVKLNMKTDLVFYWARFFVVYAVCFLTVSTSRTRRKLCASYSAILQV